MVAFVLGAVPFLLALQATQPSSASIVGTVRDAETGGPLAGATVVLPELDRLVVTGADGRYLLRHVAAGPQHVAVRFIGHAPRTLHALVPPAGQVEINVSLVALPHRLAALEVRTPIAVRGLDSDGSTVFPDRAASIAAVVNHPLAAEPDVFQALSGGEVQQRPETPEGMHIRGGESDQTSYLLDGVPVFSPYHAAGVSSAWNPDAIAELHIAAAAPSPTYPHALSGTVAGTTRTPGSAFRTQGAVSTTQARLTADGPLGVAGAGYLISARSGMPGLLAKANEPSYLKGETRDWLGTLEAPAASGRLRFLMYDNANELDAAASAQTLDGPAPAARRHVFSWRSRSLGAQWRGTFAGTSIDVRSWRATGRAAAEWVAPASPVEVTSSRVDEGGLVSLDFGSDGARTVVGLRLERSGTSYRVRSDSAADPDWRLGARTMVTTAFAEHQRALGTRTTMRTAISLASMGGSVRTGPRAEVGWRPIDQVRLSGSYSRSHQFTQSLRNAESVVGSVFPADLPIGAGAPGIPVARSDLGVLAGEYQPGAGLRIGIQAYDRVSRGLLLVAPRDGDPFSTGDFVVGSGRAHGLSADASLSRAHYALLASYGMQTVKLQYGDSSYVPDHGATHVLEGGVIVFPTPTFSMRVGGTGALRRRGTPVNGGFEWESCNLLDRGCEFGGSPNQTGESLGASRLPPYWRVDVGFRKHWHLEVGERDALVALFGSVTNILSRKNILTYSAPRFPANPAAIEMRPLAPLVLGLDWRF